MPRRYAHKIDDNQPEVVKLFRKLGANVLVLSTVGKGCPDLLVAAYKRLMLVEIKDGKKPLSQQKLTKDEQKFYDVWRDNVMIVRDEMDVTRVMDKLRSNR